MAAVRRRRRPLALPAREPGESLARYHARRRAVCIAACSYWLSERYIAVGFGLSRARVREILEQLQAAPPAQSDFFFAASAMPRRRDSRGRNLPTRPIG